jgi:hypothetical protein
VILLAVDSASMYWRGINERSCCPGSCVVVIVSRGEQFGRCVDLVERGDAVRVFKVLAESERRGRHLTNHSAPEELHPLK